MKLIVKYISAIGVLLLLLGNFPLAQRWMII